MFDDGRRNGDHLDAHTVRQPAIVGHFPPGLLQIGDHDDTALARADQLGGSSQRGAIARAAGSGRQLRHGRERERAIRRGRHHDGRRVGEGHQRDGVRRGRGSNRVLRRLSNALDLAGRRQAHRGIRHDHRDGRRRRRHGARDVRPRERHRQQHERRDPQDQQDDLAQPPAAVLLDRRARQQADRGKIDHDLGAAVKEVKQDRHRRGDRADQKQRREERHAKHHSTLRRVIKYDINPSSSGCDVSSRQ